jgi:hypothetical protein
MESCIRFEVRNCITDMIDIAMPIVLVDIISLCCYSEFGLLAISRPLAS